MSEHYRTLSAVFPIIIKKVGEKRQVLLHKRANTRYMDGMWDFAGSGHVDEGETAKQAIVRECKEELGITVTMGDIVFAHLSHRLGKDGARTYYDIYFVINHFDGIPFIAEPHKCGGLEWFDVSSLPADIIDIRKMALENYLSSVSYSELFVENKANELHL